MCSSISEKRPETADRRRPKSRLHSPSLQSEHRNHGQESCAGGRERLRLWSLIGRSLSPLKRCTPPDNLLAHPAGEIQAHTKMDQQWAGSHPAHDCLVMRITSCPQIKPKIHLGTLTVTGPLVPLLDVGNIKQTFFLGFSLFPVKMAY